MLQGPFAGMTLTPSAEQQHVGPYLLGTYEMELHDWVEQCLRGSYQQIVVIGSSFSYYAVGLARHFRRRRSSRSIRSWWARRAVAEMAAANGPVEHHARTPLQPVLACPPPETFFAHRERL